MNRKGRRSASQHASQISAAAGPAPLPKADQIEDFYAAATHHRRRGEFAPAQRLCRSILERNPKHLRSLVLLGDLVQQEGRNKLALKLLKQALALDCSDGAAHDTIAITYQALGRRDEAIRHFTQAMALGLLDAEVLVKQNPAVASALKRLAEAWPRQLRLDELLGPEGATPLGADALLLAMLRSKVNHDLELERLFTMLRRGLLEGAATGSVPAPEAGVLDFYCALAEQCFLNEYVFALSDRERALLAQLRDRAAEALKSGAPVSIFDLLAMACYRPLYKLPMAPSLLDRSWPDAIDRLLTQQIREPVEAAADRPQIPALTVVEDSTSLRVQNQYEENPYPQWTAVPEIRPTTVVKFLHNELGIVPASWPLTTVGVDILIAGCGTGSHSTDSALRFPHARLLAIDISRASLAYARMKSRALQLTNIEYAQADILELAMLDRRFDVIEAGGVLHHIADPQAAWRVLLSLLRPNGLMAVGLYSAAARRPLSAARSLIAEHGYRPTTDDIRDFRQDLIRRDGMPSFRDFSSISGCRDLLFHAMEHQFTLLQIKEFLDLNHLTFLGFEQLPPHVMEQFCQQYSDPAAVRDLACWHVFEEKHPLVFGSMYSFWVQKSQAG